MTLLHSARGSLRAKWNFFYLLLLILLLLSSSALFWVTFSNGSLTTTTGEKKTLSLAIIENEFVIFTMQKNTKIFLQRNKKILLVFVFSHIGYEFV